MPTMAVTGHRPDKLGGYDSTTFDQLRYFAEHLIELFEPTLVIVGMAQGWDQAMASAALLRKVPFHAYVPFTGQESVWPEDAQKRYKALLGRAAEVKIISPGEYAAWKMQARNEAIVDALTGDDDYLVALYSGAPGGTANCVDYAQQRGVLVVNVYNRWRSWIYAAKGAR